MQLLAEDWEVERLRLAKLDVVEYDPLRAGRTRQPQQVIEAIAGLDADVTSIEAARSHMEVLDDLNASGFHLGVGPGVYDIHSPRVPSVEEITASLRAALDAVPAERLWVNPDCGLKTRGSVEVEAALRNMVAAAAAVR